MEYVGLIAVKEESKRFPGKNYALFNGKELYKHSEDALKGFCDTHVFKSRPPAASLPEEPIFQVWQWAYKTLEKRYDAVICILANCPQHTTEGIKKAVDRFEKLGCDELRSYSDDGSESGIIIMKEDYLLNKHQISTYQGSIVLNSVEIHYKEDLEDIEQKDLPEEEMQPVKNHGVSHHVSERVQRIAAYFAKKNPTPTKWANDILEYILEGSKHDR